MYQETQQQEETLTEKEFVSILEKPGESTKSEKPSVADGESQQLAVKGNDTEIIDMKETENLIVMENVMLWDCTSQGKSGRE